MCSRGGLTTVDQAVVDRRIVAVMHEGDPDKVEAYLRPELCKDVQNLACRSRLRQQAVRRTVSCDTPLSHVTKVTFKATHTHRYLSWVRAGTVIP